MPDAAVIAAVQSRPAAPSRLPPLSSADEWQPSRSSRCCSSLVGRLSESFPIATENLHDLRVLFRPSCSRWPCWGPAPAVAIGVSALAFDAVRRAPAPPRASSTNVWALRRVPRSRARFADAMLARRGVPRARCCSPAAVLAVFLATNLLNFLLIVGRLDLTEGLSLSTGMRQSVAPVLPAEFATALLTAGGRLLLPCALGRRRRRPARRRRAASSSTCAHRAQRHERGVRARGAQPRARVAAGRPDRRRCSRRWRCATT